MSEEFSADELLKQKNPSDELLVELKRPTIRWRQVTDEYGRHKVESNTRLVTWPDGSVHLMIGSGLAFEVKETALSKDSASDVYTEIQSGKQSSATRLLQGCGSVTQKLSVTSRSQLSRFSGMSKQKSTKGIKQKAFLQLRLRRHRLRYNMFPNLLDFVGVVDMCIVGDEVGSEGRADEEKGTRSRVRTRHGELCQFSGRGL